MKTYIVGPVSSAKSILARKLSKRLNIPNEEKVITLRNNKDINAFLERCSNK